MKTLSLEEVRAAVGGRWASEGEIAAVRGVATDSRTAREGELFFALRGARFDGHAFLAQAAAAGCCAAVVADDAAIDCAAAAAFPGRLIAVADTTRALGDLAAHHRRLVRAAVVAVTGSNGKTTVKRMVHHILSRRLRGSASPKSFNNAVGVPLTLLAVAPDDDYVVCELGTNAPGEIAALAEMSRPDVAVITSVGPSHLERFGTVERIAAEKAAILGPLAGDGLAVVWADSEPLDRAVRPYGRRPVRFGQSPSADLRLTGREARGSRQRFQLNGQAWFDLPLPGRHNALNALAAVATAGRFGFSPRQAGEALADFRGEPMRLEWQALAGGTVINDAYNANPASLAAAAEVLAAAGGRRKVIIVGDMLELGEQAEALHLQAGRGLAAAGVDLVVAVGALGRYIAQGAAEDGCAAAAFDDVPAAAARMGELLAAGDTVLLKASRGAALERLLDSVRESLRAGPR